MKKSQTQSLGSYGGASRHHSCTCDCTDAGFPSRLTGIWQSDYGAGQSVSQFSSGGEIDNRAIANSLLAKLSAAEAARRESDCATAAAIYRDFIAEMQAQSRKHAVGNAAQINDSTRAVPDCDLSISVTGFASTSEIEEV